MIDQCALKRGQPEPSASTEVSIAAIHFTVFSLKLITGLVIGCLVLCTGTLIMGGFRFREAQLSQDHLSRELMDIQRQLDDMSALSRTHKQLSDRMMTELRHVQDHIDDAEDSAEGHAKEIKRELEETKDDLEEKIKDVKGGQDYKHYLLKQVLKDERRQLETYMDKHETRAIVRMKDLQQRMFFQFDATNDHVAMGTAGTTGTLTTILQGMTRFMESRFKDAVRTTFLTYERMKKTLSQKMKMQTKAINQRAASNMIVMRSRMNSIYNHIFSTVLESKTSLREALRREVELGTQSIESTVRYAWSSLRSNLNTLSKINLKLQKQTGKSFSTYSKITKSMLEGQNYILKGHMDKQSFNIELLFQEQNKLIKSEFSDQTEQMVIMSAAQDTTMMTRTGEILALVESTTDDLEEAVKDYTLERTEAIRKQNVDTRKIFGNKMIKIEEHFDTFITTKTNSIITELWVAAEKIFAYSDANTTSILNLVGYEAEKIKTYQTTNTSSILTDVWASYEKAVTYMHDNATTIKNKIKDFQEDTFPTKCSDAHNPVETFPTDYYGKFILYPPTYENYGFEGICYVDLEKAAAVTGANGTTGQWLLVQLNKDSGQFYKTMEQYVSGFAPSANAYWIGLDALHRITNGSSYQLLILLLDKDGEMTEHRLYGTFKVGEGPGYALEIGGNDPFGDSDVSATFDGLNGADFKADNSPAISDSLYLCYGNMQGGFWIPGNTCQDTYLNGNVKFNGVTKAGSMMLMQYTGPAA